MIRIILCLLVCAGYSEEKKPIKVKGLTEKEFKRIVAAKGDKKPLIKELLIYSQKKISSSTINYNLPNGVHLKIKTKNESKTVDGKYIATTFKTIKTFVDGKEQTEDNKGLVAQNIVYYDKKLKKFVCQWKFTHEKFSSARVNTGKLKDKSTVIWYCPLKDDGYAICTEKISEKMIFTSEKYYDKDKKYIYSGSVTTVYE